MIQIDSRKNQHLAVFGLGASGLATAQALAASGAVVLAWDDNEDQRRHAESNGIPLHDLYQSDFAALDAMVLAPGIPLTHRPHVLVDKATAAGRPIIGDVELLVEACPQANFIGVTGTNGKSTTTALIGHILDQAGLVAQIGGNLGPPALGFDRPAPGNIVVLELSSYQLDLTVAATFDIAVLLNLSPDHLDRHGTMEGYIAAKKRIFRDRAGVEGGQIAVIGIDDDDGHAILNKISAREGWMAIPVATGRRLERGVFVLDGALFDAIDGGARNICDLSALATLPGSHNWQNAAAAYATVRTIGVAPNIAAAALSSYPGLPHRMEHIATIGGVRYVNDSKATNVAAAARAIACSETVYWIAGGQTKEDGLEAILREASHIRHAFLIGEAEDAFAALLDGHIPQTRCGDLASAVRVAHEMAQNNNANDPVVLLSPACASFDQWKNFEARGDAFRDLVENLAMGATP